MRVEPGKSYRVRVRLGDAHRLHPAWLVGAVRATYPKAEVASVQPMKEHAEAIVRWRAAAGDIHVGDVLQPVAEGLQVPGLSLPSATVEEVTEYVPPLPPPPAAVTTRSGPLPAVLERPGALNAAKLALAVLLVGVTTYFTHRIGAKHGKPR
jgi:hypothetical protein